MRNLRQLLDERGPTVLSAFLGGASIGALPWIEILYFDAAWSWWRIAATYLALVTAAAFSARWDKRTWPARRARAVAAAQKRKEA
jgi:hypothetical protein